MGTRVLPASLSVPLWTVCELIWTALHSVGNHGHGHGLAWHAKSMYYYYVVTTVSRYDCNGHYRFVFFPQPGDLSLHGTTILGISEQSYDHHIRILEIASHFGIVFDPGRQTTAAPNSTNLGRIAHRSTLAGISAGAPTYSTSGLEPGLPTSERLGPRARAHRHEPVAAVTFPF